VKFTIRNKEKLQSDVERLLAVLSRHNLLRHVRRVVAIGSMDNGDESDDRYRQFSPGRRNADNNSDSDSDNVFGGRFITGSPLSTQQKQTQNEAWLPFAKFLGQLPALTDLVYACRHQIPPCVLTALHKNHPKSRLHIDAFSLRSLLQERHQLHDVDPDDFALATSPCLYNIRAKCMPYDDWGRFDFNLEALESIVASRCAPNLSKLEIHNTSPSGTLALVEVIREPREPREGFFHTTPDQPITNAQQQTPATPERAHLDTLVLSGIRSNPIQELEVWNTRTDYRTLRRFEYHSRVSAQALQNPASMSASGLFRSLKELGLTVSSKDSLENTTTHLDQPAALFLRNLPPLQTLILRGCFGRNTVNAVLRCHGPTLRKLHLLSPRGDGHTNLDIDVVRVREIQQRCPRLEDVELRVRRRQGGPEEVAVYRTLGQIPRLQRAALLLDCHSPYQEPEGDVARVRKTLVNLALDASLAKAIFHELASVAANHPLKRLTLKPDVSDSVAEQYPEIDELGRWIGRSWTCTRRETSGEVTVREIGFDATERQYIRNNLEMVEYEDEDVWGALWPNKGGDWQDDWHSFPLWHKENGAGVADKERRHNSELQGTTVTPL
jgi:hypothetical protein